MKLFWILFGSFLGILCLVLLISYGCYRMAFHVRRPKVFDPEAIDLPQGPLYEPYHEKMEYWIREARKLPQEQVHITSFDGLTLYGKYYEFAPGAPIELMFHGYRGSAERDLSGGVQRCFKLGRSALIVDQRCSGRSGGHAITFGVKEYRDCLAWVDFAAKKFGPQSKIILTGISMGASTVLMAAGKPLPPNVIGVLADCGFTSARDIIQTVIRQMKLPAKLVFPFVRLGARIFAGFDPEEYSALEAMSHCTVPVIFFHGEDDDYVPCDMSRRNYEACTARKQLVTIPGAGHGLSYPTDPKGYIAAAGSFFAAESDPAIPQ